MSYTQPQIGQDPWGDDLLTGLDQFDARLNALAFNVKEPDFGAVGDGTTDDTAAIQAAVDAAAVLGGCVIIPPGTFSINLAINVPFNVHVIGAGNAASDLLQTVPDQDGIVIAGHGDFPVRAGVHNLRLTGPGHTGGGTGRGVVISALDDFEPAYGGVVERVYVEEFPSHAFHFDGTFMTKVSHCDAWTNGGTGFFCDGGTFSQDNGVTPSTGTFETSMTFDTCYANGNFGWGYDIRKATYMSYISCAADSNALGAYSVFDCTGITFTSCGAESTEDPAKWTTVGKQPYGWKITGTAALGSSGITLVGCYSYCNTNIPFWWLAETDVLHGTGRADGVMIGCRELTIDAVNADFEYGLVVGNGAYVTAFGCALPGAPSSDATKTMLVEDGGKLLLMAPADAAGNAQGISFDDKSPTLFPYKDSLQAFNKGNVNNAVIVAEGMTGQTGALFRALTPTGQNLWSLYPYGDGTMNFGADETIYLARPGGSDFLATNAPFQIPSLSSVSALNSTYPAGSYYGCLATVATDKGIRLVMSDGAMWTSPFIPPSGYNQAVTQAQTDGY